MGIANKYASIGLYRHSNILNNKEIGSLEWIEYRSLKDGSSAFKEIHDGKCISPKIILLT